MSTSPELVLPRGDEHAAPAVFSPIPQVAVDRASRSVAVAPRSSAAGYAAGWAQGVAAAAVGEQQTISRLEAAAAAQRAALLARTEATLAALDAATEAMRARTTPTVDAHADAIAAAAVELAEVVVGAHVAADASCGRTALDRALAIAPEHARVVVRMNPADLASMSELGAAQPAGAHRGVELVADASIASGDAVADYPGGSVDARIATAFERMRGALRTGERA